MKQKVKLLKDKDAKPSLTEEEENQLKKDEIIKRAKKMRRLAKALNRLGVVIDLEQR